MADPIYGDVLGANRQSNYNRRQQGVFSEFPLTTPKYAINRGNRDAEFKETLARMFISLANANKETIDSYLASLPADSRIQALAKVLIGQGQKPAAGFIDFFLTQINESFQEKLQVDEVLGDNYVAWYFGQAPPVFTYSGWLLNSQQDDQTTGFLLAYQNLLRGTQLARRGTFLRLRYDNVIVGGSINSMSRVLNADNEMACPFNFTLLVKEMILIKLPRFTKMAASDFVQLTTQFAAASVLGQVGTASDIRVRTTALLPQQLAQESVVGQEEPEEPVNASLPAPQRLTNQLQSSVQNPVTTDLNVDPGSLSSNPPPTPNVTSFSGGI
jgi:hypothetical protein